MDILTLATITLAFAAGLMLAVGASRYMLADRGAIKQRLQTLATYSAGAEQGQQPATIRADRTRDALQGGWGAKTGLQLERAGLQLRVSEYMLIRFLAGAFGFLLVVLISGGHPAGLIVGAIVAVVGFMAPAFVVLTLRGRRVQKINEELDQMVSMMSSSLKAGFGLLQSLDQAAQQLRPPLSNELLRVIHETDVGATVEESLTALADRVESYDLDMTVTAILVQRTVGGNLAEVLDNVGQTIRERVRIQGEINTLTAQKKLSGIVIGVLPLALALLFFALDPEYMSTLFTNSAGRILLAIGVGLDVLGLLMIRRILMVDI